MKIRKIFPFSILFIVVSSMVFAQVYTSPNYKLGNARIVVSGGKANSASFNIVDVQIGNIFGGKAGSASYSLEAASSKRETLPNPPVLNPVKNPTNNSVQTLTGTKDILTSIYINGYEVIPLNNEITWSHGVTLSEGDNNFIITARNKFGLESASVSLTITLDTIPPFVIIDYPLDSTIVTTAKIMVDGTSDGAPFSEEKDLNFGSNLVSIEISDQAGNLSSKSVEIYLVREPIAPPGI